MRVQQTDQRQYKGRTMDRLLQVNPVTRVSDMGGGSVDLTAVLVLNLETLTVIKALMYDYSYKV